VSAVDAMDDLIAQIEDPTKVLLTVDPHRQFSAFRDASGSLVDSPTELLNGGSGDSALRRFAVEVAAGAMPSELAVLSPVQWDEVWRVIVLYPIEGDEERWRRIAWADAREIVRRLMNPISHTAAAGICAIGFRDVDPPTLEPIESDPGARDASGEVTLGLVLSVSFRIVLDD